MLRFPVSSATRIGYRSTPPGMVPCDTGSHNGASRRRNRIRFRRRLAAVPWTGGSSKAVSRDCLQRRLDGFALRRTEPTEERDESGGEKSAVPDATRYATCRIGVAGGRRLGVLPGGGVSGARRARIHARLGRRYVDWRDQRRDHRRQSAEPTPRAPEAFLERDAA